MLPRPPGDSETSYPDKVDSQPDDPANPKADEHGQGELLRPRKLQLARHAVSPFAADLAPGANRRKRAHSTRAPLRLLPPRTKIRDRTGS